jgi:hypothetical protein
MEALSAANALLSSAPFSHASGQNILGRTDERDRAQGPALRVLSRISIHWMSSLAGPVAGDHESDQVWISLTTLSNTAVGHGDLSYRLLCQVVGR